MSRPPADITPATFFEEWLPAQVPAGKASGDVSVRYTLDGEGGGSWRLAIGPSGMTTAPGDRAHVDVGIRQTVADWRAVTTGEPGAISLAPPQAAPTDLLFLDRGTQQVVKQGKGTIRFEVTGYNGRTWSLLVKLGPDAGQVGDSADATISVDAETYGAILARTLPAPAAYFSGKIKLTGDMNLAMQLGMALMPRLG
jgi:SCP-2 sterol transfer family